MTTNLEQRRVIEAMDRLYARVHRLRDLVRGDDWDDDNIYRAAENVETALLAFRTCWELLK